MWRRWNELSGPERYEFWSRAGLYLPFAAALLFVDLTLARAPQVRVPGLVVFLLLSAGQAGACAVLLHASVSRYLARGPTPRRWLVAAAIALTAAGVLAGAVNRAAGRRSRESPLGQRGGWVFDLFGAGRTANERDSSVRRLRARAGTIGGYADTACPNAPHRARVPRQPKQLDAGIFQAEISSFALRLAAEGKAVKTIRTYTDAVQWFAPAPLPGQADRASWEQVDG